MRARLLIALLALAAGAAITWLVISPAPQSSTATADSDSSADEPFTQIIEVTRQDLFLTERVNATVGFGQPWALPIEVDGLVTAAPPEGTLLTSGDAVVEVGGLPVVLVDGAVPLHRELLLLSAAYRDEAGTRTGRLKGEDVAQLQRFLLAEGFDDAGRLEADAEFGVSTQRAVRAWQLSVGHPATGTIDRSQMLFIPEDVRMQSAPDVGQPFSEILVTRTAATLNASVPTNVKDFFQVGSVASIRVTDESTIAATVTSSTRITTNDELRQWVEMTIDDVSPDALSEVVTVTATQLKAEDALSLPVRALLATSGGGWVVEVPDGDGTKTVAVELESVVGTSAVISGLDEGTEVVLRS